MRVLNQGLRSVYGALRRAGAIIAAIPVVADCVGRETCPDEGTIRPGSACAAEELQCPYPVTVVGCDGSRHIVESSCTCAADEVWECVGLVADLDACDSAEATEGGGADGLGSDGTDDDSTVDEATDDDAPIVPTGPPPGSSCPYIYAWNGERFEYQTDIEGQGIGLPPSSTLQLGIPHMRGAAVKLPTARYDNEQGLELRVREVLAEASYADQLRLLLVDHPPEYEVYHSSAERTFEWGYVEPLRVLTVSGARTPESAIDWAGADVLEYVLEVDNHPAPISEQDLDHYVFDFGPIAYPERAKLVIDGWFAVPIPAAHEVQPSIDAEDADGNWVHVREFGVPSGDLKTMVIQLGDGLPDDVRRIRVNLGMVIAERWVIDRIRLDESEPYEAETTELEPLWAELVYRGAATQSRATTTSRIVAVDDEQPLIDAALMYGSFTRYGDVTELVLEADDMHAIMRHGDQLTLQFPGSVPPPVGMVRSVMLEATIWYKDGRLSNTVEPLPFAGMTAYPYFEPEAYPDDAEHREYRDRYNRRVYEDGFPEGGAGGLGSSDSSGEAGANESGD